MKPLYTFCLGVLLAVPAWAQMPQDAIYMSRNKICVAATYGRSQWSEYWENQLQRENSNIGTHTTQSASVMVAAGITNKLNLIVNLPYVWTQTSAGNLMGQRGFQDVSAWLKYRAVEVGGFSLHGVVGGSIPASNYVPDFLPMSIGIQSRTLTGRVLAHYKHRPTGLYVTGHGSYIWRSNITLDRDSYQAYERLFNTNEVAIPNAWDAAVRVGYQKRAWQAEAFVERFSGVSGDNIRRNDMPFPTNNMQMTMAGGYVKYQPHNIGLNARVGQTIAGRNVGLTTSYMVGLLYQFAYRK